MPIVGQFQQSVYTTPIVGGALDPAVVLGNDNNTRLKHNSHDADATIHVQSSTLATRSAPSTVGRIWITSDGLRAYHDTGAAWAELAYLPSVGGTVSGAVTFSAAVTGTTAAFSTRVSVGAADLVRLELASDGVSPRLQSYSSRSLYLNELGNAVNIGGGVRQTGADSIRIENTFTGVPVGSAGAGAEIGVSSGSAFFQGYNRTTLALGPVTINASAISLNGAATFANAVTISTGGLVVTAGGITVTGNSTITGTLGGITTLTATTVFAALSGNATTATTASVATALQTARAINGVNFDGTAAITVTAAAGTLSGATLAAGVTASSLTSVGTLTSLTVGTGGAVISKILSATVVWDIPSVVAGGVAEVDVTVTGAVANDVALVAQTSTLPGYNAITKATVVSADTVKLTFQNNTTSAFDPASQTVRVIVFRV